MKAFEKIGLLLIVLFAVAVTSCGSDEPDDNNTTSDEKQNVAKNIIGYWTGFSNGTLSSYTFISFGADMTYAMYLNDEAFSSGTYTIEGNVISLRSGYDDSVTTINISDVTTSVISFKIGTKSYKGTKSSETALNLENILIGKSYTTYLASRPIITTFNTKYSATREYRQTVTKKLYIYWQYIYNGTNLYVKNFQSPNEQHASVGGWNTYTEGMVYIYNVTMSGGSIESVTTIPEQK